MKSLLKRAVGRVRLILRFLMSVVSIILAKSILDLVVGYPHAYECGCDHMKLIIENLYGKANSILIGEYAKGVFMMKYNEIMIR